MSDRDPRRAEFPGVFFSLSATDVPPAQDGENQALRDRLRTALGEQGAASETIADLLRIGADWLGVDNGCLTHIDPATGTYEIDRVSGPHGALEPGETTDLSTTYCRWVIANGKALGVGHASEQGWADDAAYETLGLEAYLGAKIVVEGRLYGTVFFADAGPYGEPFTETHATALKLVVGSIAQVLEREHSDDPRRRTWARLDALFEASPNMVHIHDAHGNILLPNPRLCEQTGYSEEELVQMKVWELQADRTSGEDTSAWTNVGADTAREWEDVFRWKDGSTVPVHVHVQSIQIDGRACFVVTSRDISKRKADERALRETNRRLQAVLDTVDAAIFIKGREGRYQLINQRCRELFGIGPEEEIVAKTDYDFFPTEVADRYREGDRRVMEEGRTIRMEEEVPAPNGTQVNLTLKSPLRDESGTPVGVCAVSTDITERKKKERALRRLKVFNQELVERAPVGLVRLDENLRITYENPRAERIFGIPDDQDESDAIGVDIRELPSVAEAGMIEKIDRLLEGEEISLDLEFHSIYGRNAHVRGRGVPLTPDGVFEGAVIMIEDVSEQKERERTLRDRQEKVKSLYRAADRLLRANTPASVAARIQDLLKDVFAYPVAAVALRSDQGLVFQGGASDGDGEDSPDRARSVSEDSPLSRAYRTGETVHVGEEERGSLANPDVRSGAVVPIGQHGVVLIGQDDTDDIDAFDLRLTEVLATYAALVLDHLEREDELVDARDEAERMNRMKSAFLANMSHEIRTPLTSIIGFAEVIGEEVDAEVEGTVARFADLIEESGRRLLETLDAVLDLSKLEAGEIQLDRDRVALAQVIEETVELRRIEAEKQNVGLELHVPDSPIRGWWNRGAVNRIVTNLVDNAIKFTPGTGQVVVRVSAEASEAVIEVEDTGIGIQEDMRPHIFDAFKQESEGLTREYDGTGLGLSIVRSMVHLLDGSVEVDSTPGEGTRFVVRLPRRREDDGSQ